jgi:integrase
MMLCDGGGLYLQTSLGVDGEVKRSWIFRYKLRGRERERWMGLGPLHKVSLALAREKAANYGRQRDEGIDPIAVRNFSRAAAAAAHAKAMTFGECAAEYIKAQQAGWSNVKHAAQWAATVTKGDVSQVLGRLPVSAIDVDLVVKVLRPIWHAKRETASRIRGRIEAILDWATVKKLRQGDNPARWQGNLEHLLSKRSREPKHHAALPYADIGAFMDKLRKRDGVAARALEFVVLTAGRSGEVLGARWDEIDLQARLWTVPASRMKAGKEHRIPLSGAASAVLERMAKVRESEFVFPSTQRAILSDRAMRALLERMGRSDLTVHGFRSTFRDWGGERTNFPNEMLEMALAHTVSDKVEAAYRRGDMFDKRRRLMDAWAAYCNKPKTTGEVVPLRADNKVPA